MSDQGGRLADRVALVSGASRGIGFAIARRFAEEGARTVLTARGKEGLSSAEASLRELGHSVDVVPGDMTTESDVARAVTTSVERHGRLDIVVGNVYPRHTGGFATTSNDDFVAEFEGLFMSTVHLARAALPHMREVGWGRIVNVGSLMMRGPVREIPMILSAAMRPAVVGFHRALANEVGRDGVTVNNLAVGLITTERLRESAHGRLDEELSWDELERLRVEQHGIPVPRFGRPEEVAGTAAFLCSEEGAYITGQTILIDGGMFQTLF